jgi:hypothetical protein
MASKGAGRGVNSTEREGLQWQAPDDAPVGSPLISPHEISQGLLREGLHSIWLPHEIRRHWGHSTCERES